MSPKASTPHTLSIDIGGTGIKMIRLDASGEAIGERQRELTPKPASPEAVVDVIRAMVALQDPFDRVSVGFPGVVVQGVVRTANNLGTELWRGFDIDDAVTRVTGKSTRVINDADLQGYGVVEKKGVELVLTLGTGLGSALFVDGRLVPNLEIAHHPLRKDKTYEELVGASALAKSGKKKWRRRVSLAIETLAPIFNYDRLHLGGGNAKKLAPPLPERVELFQNVEGLEGGAALWDDAGPKG